MTREQRFFLGLLGDHARGEETAPPEDSVDMAAVAAIARRQCLGGVAFAQCKAWLTPESSGYGPLFQDFLSDVFYSVCRQQDLQELTEVFTQAGIPFCPMKGAVLRNYYPIPELRTMGDMDLVIPAEHRKRCRQEMEKRGFRFHTDNDAVWSYDRDKVSYEIHTHMIYEPLANSVDYRAYFDRVWNWARPDHGARWTMDPSFHFVYLVTHTAKHILNKGYGFRPFLDLVFASRDMSLDWAWIGEELRKLRLYDFCLTCFSLCRRWFGVEMPLEEGTISPAFYESATAKVFQDGIFGHGNPDNAAAADAKLVRRSTMPLVPTLLLRGLELLFPPYRDMRLIPWYAFVDGRPWLLPAAWVYRWGYCARRKLSYGLRMLVSPITGREAVKKRQTLIDSWKL